MCLALDDQHVSDLLAASAEVPVVDAHQHLGPEAPVRTDLCALLAGGTYLAGDLTAAGMTAELQRRIMDTDAPLMERWQLLAPLWERVRHGAYARAIRITLRDLYVVGELTAGEVPAASHRVQADFAAPGIFARVLQDRCGIRAVLTQGGYFDHQIPRFYNVARPLDRADFSPDGPFEEDARQLGIELRRPDDVPVAMDAILRDHRARGAVGFKIAAFAWKPATRDEVADAFRQRAARPVEAEVYQSCHPLVRLYVERIAALAEELDVPVAVHTGAPWSNWLDFRVWEPTTIIPLLMTYRGTRFDLYHAGLPYGTRASMMGKTFPNVWLNLTWAHVISPELAMRGIAEWLDIVPTNKVVGFGGDYSNDTVVLTYGHLAMARQNLARVLGYRVKEGRMGHDEAVEVLRAWFWDNPNALYKLPKM